MFPSFFIFAKFMAPVRFHTCTCLRRAQRRFPNGSRDFLYEITRLNDATLRPTLRTVKTSFYFSRAHKQPLGLQCGALNIQSKPLFSQQLWKTINVSPIQNLFSIPWFEPCTNNSMAIRIRSASPVFSNYCVRIQSGAGVRILSASAKFGTATDTQFAHAFCLMKFSMNEKMKVFEYLITCKPVAYLVRKNSSNQNTMKRISPCFFLSCLQCKRSSFQRSFRVAGENIADEIIPGDIDTAQKILSK